MKNIKRILCLCLAALMCCGLLVGCSDDKNPDTDVQTKDTSGDIVSKANLNLPELDYDGAEISMLVRTQSLGDVYSEGVSGDVVSKAVFERNVAVQDLLNVTFNYTDMNGFSAGADAFCNAIRVSAMTGGIYDIVSPTQSFGNTLIVEDLYTDLGNYEYLDLSETYWADGYNIPAKINGKQYTIAGDYSLGLLGAIVPVFFNKEYYEAFKNVEGIEHPYDLVKNDQWTIEKMLNISKLVTYDVDNNGAWDENDQYGWGIYYHDVASIPISLGLKYVDNDNGDYYFGFSEEKAVDIFDLISNAMTNSTLMYYGDDSETMDRSFMRGKVMFLTRSLSTAITLKATDVDYGILVPPKYDEEQEEYYSCTGSAVVFAITNGLSAERAERASAVLQACAYYSYVYVIPAYFETVMKGQAAKDPETYEMLDLVRETAYCDIGMIYSRSLGGVYHAYGTAIKQNISIATWWAQNQSSLDSVLGELLSYFDN